MTEAASGVLPAPSADPAAGTRADQEAAPKQPGNLRWRGADGALVSCFVVFLVLTQRIGVPVADTSISVGLPVAYVFLAVLGLRRSITLGRLRVELFLLAAIGVLLTTAVVALQGRDISITSLVLLLSIYLLWTVRAAGDRGREVVFRAGRAFVHVMVVLAAVGVGQFVAQLAGLWAYEDYLGEWVSPQYLVPNYNTSIPLSFESEIFKSNAFVMLEPSAFSQFCALAVLIALLLRARAWQVLLLAAGLGSAVSGTGIILLGAGVLLMLFRAPRLLRPGYVAAFAITVGLVFLSPAGAILLDRTGEVSQPESSGYARFVAPYQEVSQGLADESQRYATGAGPGAVERQLDSNRNGVGNDVLYGVIPKLAFEYGVVAGGLVALFLVLGLTDRAPWRVIPGALLIMTFFLSGALLQPQTAILAWLFTGFGAQGRDTAASRGDEAAPDD